MSIEKLSLNPIGTEDAKRITNKVNEVIETVNTGGGTGIPGPQGPQGEKGEKGDPGETPDLSNYYNKGQVDGLISALDERIKALEGAG